MAQTFSLQPVVPSLARDLVCRCLPAKALYHLPDFHILPVLGRFLLLEVGLAVVTCLLVLAVIKEPIKADMGYSKWLMGFPTKKR
jgi:hypothetical protein